MMKSKRFLLIFFFVSGLLNGKVTAFTEPDWSKDFKLPVGTDRENIYGLDGDDLAEVLRRGRLHTLHYPVEPTGMLFPWNAFEMLLTGEGQNKLRKILGEVATDWSGFQSMDDVTKWLGLFKFPLPSEQLANPYEIPYPFGEYPSYRMGVTLKVDDNGDVGASFGCATCHTGNLFGRKVLGLTNRIPRANEIFLKAKMIMPKVTAEMFQALSGATDGEREMYRRTAYNLNWVGVKRPAAVGLDTSLAQVALSLSRRGVDSYAEKNIANAIFPRSNDLSHFVADSKPAVWWNLKYKTRWLSDGSIVSGNPIFTNFLWNEIGRGVDLHDLEKWMDRSKEVEREITAAVFSSKPPRWTDFFPAASLSIEKAKVGQVIFNQHCARCHGQYVKGWELYGDSVPIDVQISTIKVLYHEKTPVVNVGTDPNRAAGISAFADDLNRLQISKGMGTKVEVQHGYVPPPLVGIWSRWPYFHNNSVPTLCDVLTVGSLRRSEYWTIPADDPQTDFDKDCVGYPIGEKVPKHRRVPEFRFTAGESGLSNLGHDVGIILDKDGNEKMSPGDKMAVIEFLKTL